MWHVIPIDDVKGHEESTACHCNPKVLFSNEGDIVIHNSYDGREAVEQAKSILGMSDNKPIYKVDPKWRGDWIE